MNVKFTLFTLIFISLVHLFSFTSLTINYDNIMNSLCTYTSIGNSKSFTFLDINLKSQISFTTPRHFDKDASTSKSVIKSDINCNIYSYGICKCELISDSVIFENVNFTLHNFNFYLLEKGTNIYDSFAFAFKPETPEQSLTHLLYNSKQISSLSFGLTSIYNKGGNVYFGGFPDKIRSKHPFNITIPIVLNSNFWEIELYAITFNKTTKNGNEHLTINQNNKILFQSVHNYIYAPKNIIKYLNNSFFDELVTNNICDYHPTLHHFTCDCYAVNDFPQIKFVLTYKRTVLFLGKTLFYDRVLDNSYCEFLIKENLIDPFNWEIGNAFLENHFVEFNYDTKTITLLKDIPFEYILNENNKNIIKNIINFILIINLSWLVVLLITKK